MSRKKKLKAADAAALEVLAHADAEDFMRFLYYVAAENGVGLGEYPPSLPAAFREAARVFAEGGGLIEKEQHDPNALLADAVEMLSGAIVGEEAEQKFGLILAHLDRRGLRPPCPIHGADHEAEPVRGPVTWLEDVSRRPYVREGFVGVTTPEGDPDGRRALGSFIADGFKGNRVVGHAARPELSRFGARYRFFWVASVDAGEPDAHADYASGRAWPPEAVDPRTLERLGKADEVTQ